MNLDNEKDILDIHSPYIKSSVYGMDNLRNNIISTKGENKISSDSLLRQKITNVSKKIVGEEIKKFAEVAGKEISQEFESLEKRLEKNISANITRRIDFVEQNMYEYASLQSESINTINKEFSNKLETKMATLNEKIKEIENKLKKLDNFSIESKIKNEEEGKTDMEYSLDISDTADNTNKSEESEAAIIITDVEKIYDESQNIQALEYANEKVRKISQMFEKRGALFKKNTFISSLKNLDTEHFLNNKEDYTDINQDDIEKVYNILIDLMDKLEIDPKESETIELFLKRAFVKEYFISI